METNTSRPRAKRTVMMVAGVYSRRTTLVATKEAPRKAIALTALSVMGGGRIANSSGLPLE